MIIEELQPSYGDLEEELERLRAEIEQLKSELHLEQAMLLGAEAEIERLHAIHTELVEALRIAHMALELRGPGFPLDEITAAIAKAEGKL